MSYASYASRVFDDMLGTLDHLIGKAQEHGLSDEVLSARLIDDMFPLELQFRVAINQVLLALKQVAGKDVPLEASAYHSLAEVKDRIGFVRAELERAPAHNWARAEETVDLTLPNGTRFLMSSEEDIRDWIIPNFYFHVTLAYALLRMAGVEIGKMDFIPHMRRHTASATG